MILKLTYTDGDKEMYWERFERDKNAVVTFLDTWGYRVEDGYLEPVSDGIFSYYIRTKREIHSEILDVLKSKYGFYGRMKIERIPE